MPPRPSIPNDESEAFGCFHPITAEWFRAVFDEPTAPQRLGEFLSTEAVDNSVEKRGSFTLSARSVSGPVKLVKKDAEIEMILLNSKDYALHWIPHSRHRSKILQWESQSVCVSR